jgi:AcrR family transcriptional regulator
MNVKINLDTKNNNCYFFRHRRNKTLMRPHSSIKKPELVQKRQKQIFDVASKLFVQRGYHGTTVRDIARESGLGLGPIYDYVMNKEEILFLVHKEIVELNYRKIEKSLDGIKDPVEKIKKAITAQIQLCNDYEDLYLFIYQEAHILTKPFIEEIMRVERNTISLFEQILKEGQKSRVFRKMNARIAANMIILLNHGWALKRWDLKGSKDSRIHFTIDFVLKSISA